MIIFGLNCLPHPWEFDQQSSPQEGEWNQTNTCACIKVLIHIVRYNPRILYLKLIIAFVIA